MKLLRNKKFSALVTVFSFIFFLTDDLLKIPPRIAIVIDAVLIVLLVATYLFSDDNNEGQSDKSVIKPIKIIVVVVIFIFFAGLLFLKKSGVL